MVAVRRSPVRREAAPARRRAGDLPQMPAIQVGDQLPCGGKSTESPPAGRRPRRSCRFSARVPIREVWLASTATLTVRTRPVRSRTPGTCPSRRSSGRTNVRSARSTPPNCRSPRAGPCRPPSQTSRPACQFGRLASTSSAGAWTPCAGSSAAVDASGLVRRPPTGTPDHQHDVESNQVTRAGSTRDAGAR